jgi:hypothetical protein
MTKAEASTFKRRLTIAKKKGPKAVLKVTDDFFALEDDVVLPDWWHLFNVARQDAERGLRMEQAHL